MKFVKCLKCGKSYVRPMGDVWDICDPCMDKNIKIRDKKRDKVIK